MGFGNFLQGIIAQVNPFDDGKTYGSYNPPKRKLQPGDPGYVAPPSAPKAPQNPAQSQPQLKTNSSPVNLFQSNANDLKLPGAPNSAIPVVPNHSILPGITPQPGTIIKPTIPATQPQKIQANAVPNGYQQAPGITGTRATQNGQTGVMSTNRVTGQPHFVPDAPVQQKRSIWDKIGHPFNLAGQTIAGSVANIPEVGMASVRAASGLVQGVTQVPHIVTAGAATATQKLANNFDNPVTRQINRGFQDANTGTKNVTNVVQKPFNFVNQKIDQGAKAYADNVPGASAGAQVYKTTQIPINVLAGLLTLGGGTAAEGAGAAGEAGQTGKVATIVNKFQQLLNKPLTSNTDNIISKTSKAISSKTTPVVNVLNSPLSSTKTGITKLVNSRNVPNAANDLVDAGEAGNVASDVGNATQIPVTQPQPIEVGGTPGEPTSIPVTNNTPTGKPIIEVGGDKPGSVHVPTPDEVAAQRAADNFNAQAPGRPDAGIEGITKTDTGNTSPLFTKAQLANEQAALNDALKSGEIDAATHKAASTELAQNSPVDATPKGKQIQVKQVNSIPVENKTAVPTDIPSTPGQVAPTTATAPVQAESQAIANAPTPVAPPSLPKEVQNVLDNPKQFSKRQLQAARNQRKLAVKMAKTQEDTQAAITRMTSDKPTGDNGFVPSGEFSKGANGNISETAHRTLEAAQGAHDTANLSVDDVLKQAKQDMVENGVHSPSTVRNLKALRDSGTMSRTSPEFKAVNEEYKNAISNHGRALALTDRTARASATGDQLTNRFTSKLLSFADDSGKIKDSDINQVAEAENAFTAARDAANSAGEDFKASGGDRAFAGWKAAQQKADLADRHARLTEYLVSKRVLKGNKNIEASQAVADAERNAGVYSMDAIDSNMLSGTGTMTRNYINTLFPRAENKLFGRASALVARKLTGIDALGGSSGKGARIGASIGKQTYKADLAARKEAGVGFIRRAVTAGNTIGEKNIEATTYSKAFSHYKQLLKTEGYKGKELNNRAEFNVRTDPDGLVQQYQRDTLQANALSGLTHEKKVENILSDAVQKGLAKAGFGHTGQVIGRTGAKAITRVGLGFPTVIARSLVEGFKRATLGIPEVGWSTLKFMKTGDKTAYAGELSKAMQHAGTGGSLMLLGNSLGKMGVISGAYPTDPAERARWTAEGKQENSIKIGDQWYSIPGYLGGFALPLMLGATTGSGNIRDEATLKNAWSTVLSSSPVDNIQSTLDIITGNSTAGKSKNAVTSLVRAGTPAGSLVAEIAKMTDSTQNDTTTKDALHNILDSIASGIPGLNNKVNTIAKTDQYGNTLKNPNPVAQLFGAQGQVQSQGTSDVNQEQSASDQTMQQLAQYGITNDKNLMQLVDPKIAKQIQNGQQLTPQDVAKVQKAVTKGIDATQDSNWRESGNYSTDKAALQAKLQILNADPTTKPSEKQLYETQIKRDDVLQSNGISYDQLKQYEGVTLAQWRNMGDPTNDAYDPTAYQTLWAIDQVMAKGGGSYNSKDPSAQKYSAKPAGSGSGSKTFQSTFGKISGAPTVQAYNSVSQATGQVPVIQVSRPNIVHSISHSG